MVDQRGAKPNSPPRDDPTTPGPVLSETVTVGGSPGSVTAKTPPTAGTNYTIGAVASREYVSGQQTVYVANWLRSLTFNIDDITQDFGEDLYNRMMFDDAVKAAVLTLKSGILSESVEVISATVDDDEPERADLATEIAKCCRRTLRAIPNLDDALFNMCDALPLGNKVAELLFGMGRGQDKNRLVVTAIKPKKRRVISFVVDVYMNTVGFLALIPGQAFPVQIGIILSEPSNIINFLPREKFAVLSWRPEDGDPRGTSILRAAYTAWNFKMQLWGEYMKFLANFIVPSYIGFLPDQAIGTFAADPNGNLTLDSNNQPILQDPTIEMAAQLAQLRNAGAGAFPFGANVQVVQAAASASGAFDSAFAFLNDCIARAILGQTLATGEGRHDSRAAAQVHQDVLLLLVKQAKQAVCEMIQRDIFTPIVRYNWGDEALDLVPAASFGEVSEPDKAALWAAAASLGRENMIVPSQWEDLYAELGLPAASADDLAELTRRWNDALIPPDASATETGNVSGAGAPPTPAASPTNGSTPPAQRVIAKPTNGRVPATTGAK